MSIPIPLTPAALHRHAAAAAAANSSGKALDFASVGISHLSPITCNLALYCQCHCRQCRQPGHLPLTNRHHPPKAEVPGVSAPSSLTPAGFFVGGDDDDDDKRPPPLSIMENPHPQGMTGDGGQSAITHRIL